MRNPNSTLSIAAWCLYDSAVASFSIIVITFIFSTYFTTQIAPNPITGTYLWANATSIAGLIIAVSSPFFGAIADYRGYHKRWLFLFTTMCALATGLLWFAYPSPQYIYYTLGVVIVGTVGYEIAQVFYNAFLGFISPPNYIGRISGWGWGCGYLGGIIALSVALFVFVKGPPGWLSHETAAHVRICGPFAAIWIMLFSLPIFIFTPNISFTHQSVDKSIFSGFKEVLKTLKKLPKERNITLYLIAHMIYNDGLNTLFAFGGIYAAGTYGLSFEDVLLFGISMNVSAGIGAIFLAWLDDYLGPKQMVLISLVCLTGLGFIMLFLQTKFAFWTTALLLGLFVGPVQSASRTLMVKLIRTKEMSAEMFGLYALSGKITAFIGPWLFGLATLYYQTQRAGMATVLLFFAIGGILLLPVKVQDGLISESKPAE